MIAEAEKIMKKKSFIRKEMERQLGKKLSDEIWTDSTEKLSELLVRYNDLPKGVHTHTDNYIFPSASVYLCAKEKVDQKTAYSIIENSASALTNDVAQKLGNFLKIPGMPSLFIKMWDVMCKKLYGENNGFRNIYYDNKKGEYRMDVISCPFCHYFKELGCFELTKIYCENDDRVYGNLPHIEFIRTSTLGKGCDKCDFYARKI